MAGPKDTHIHKLNGVDRAEGPKAQAFEQETLSVKLMKDVVELLEQSNKYLCQLLEQGAEQLSHFRRLNGNFEDRWPPVSGPLWRKAEPASTPELAPAPVVEPKPVISGTPLESLGWRPDSSEYLAFTKRLPFPVNTVEEITSRVRKADLLAAEWVGETVTGHIEDRLNARGVGTLLPDSWQPPEGPPPTMANPAVVYSTKRDTVIPQVTGKYAGRTMTADEIAKERGLPLPEVKALLLQAEPHWNAHPHYLYHWAMQRGYVLPKNKLMDRKKKKTG